jgi:hypothetical protein
MKVGPIYGGCSVLTMGGSPATDAEFMAWAREVAEEGNARILDAYPPGRLPDRDPMPIWRLINHLIKEFEASCPVDPSALNNNHRIRFLSVRFLDRPGPFRDAAESYVQQTIAEAASEV